MLTLNTVKNAPNLSKNPKANRKNGFARVEATPKNIGVMVVDDQAVVRVGLRVLLEDTPGMHFVSEAGDLETALSALGENQPDVILLDLLTSMIAYWNFYPS